MCFMCERMQELVRVICVQHLPACIRAFLVNFFVLLKRLLSLAVADGIPTPWSISAEFYSSVSFIEGSRMWYQTLEEVVLVGFRLSTLQHVGLPVWYHGAAVLRCGLLLGEQKPTATVSNNTHAKCKSRKKKIIKNLLSLSLFLPMKVKLLAFCYFPWNNSGQHITYMKDVDS